MRRAAFTPSAKYVVDRTRPWCGPPVSEFKKRCRCFRSVGEAKSARSLSAKSIRRPKEAQRLPPIPKGEAFENPELHQHEGPCTVGYLTVTRPEDLDCPVCCLLRLQGPVQGLSYLHLEAPSFQVRCCWPPLPCLCWPCTSLRA